MTKMMSGYIYAIAKTLLRGGDYARGLYFFLLVKLCGGRCGGIPRVGKGMVLKYPPHAGYLIGKNCNFGPYCIFDVPPGGKFTVCDDVKLTAGVFVSAANEVHIGKGALIAEWAALRDSQHQCVSNTFINEQGLDVGNIRIGQDVWVGRCSSVLMNSELGDGCILGANSIVKSQSLSLNGIYVGSPARLIKSRAAAGFKIE